MGCMPYGQYSAYLYTGDLGFQSLIWVACPTGHASVLRTCAVLEVSIPHMGCMPYGQLCAHCICVFTLVSIPHMGCMPYGLHQEAGVSASDEFQSLIWVACPTGIPRVDVVFSLKLGVSIPHMGCMPYGLGEWNIDVFHSNGFNPSYGLHALRAQEFELWRSDTYQFQSLIWVACPTGNIVGKSYGNRRGFNPSYGLHALRALPAGSGTRRIACFNPSYGLHALRAVRTHKLTLILYQFQSLIWVACPTGCTSAPDGAHQPLFQSLIGPNAS